MNVHPSLLRAMMKQPAVAVEGWSVYCRHPKACPREAYRPVRAYDGPAERPHETR